MGLITAKSTAICPGSWPCPVVDVHVNVVRRPGSAIPRATRPERSVRRHLGPPWSTAVKSAVRPVASARSASRRDPAWLPTPRPQSAETTSLGLDPVGCDVVQRPLDIGHLAPGGTDHRVTFRSGPTAAHMRRTAAGWGHCRPSSSVSTPSKANSVGPVVGVEANPVVGTQKVPCCWDDRGFRCASSSQFRRHFRF